LRLCELEDFITSNIEELVRECAHVCKEPHVPSIIIEVNNVYKGCDSCIIYSSLDKLSLPTMNMKTSLGNVEYVVLEDAIIEVLEDGIIIYSLEEFEERINDLRDFGIVSEAEVTELISWIKSILKV